MGSYNQEHPPVRQAAFRRSVRWLRSARLQAPGGAGSLENTMWRPAQ